MQFTKLKKKILIAHSNIVEFQAHNLCASMLNLVYMLFTGREVRIGKNCARGLEYGPGPYSRPRAQFFPIRTDLGR